MWKRRTCSKSWPFGVGEPLDMRTFAGAFAALVISCFSLYFLWHIEDFLVWQHGLFGERKQIDSGQESWERLWAVIIGGSGIIASIVAIIMVPINRRRAQEGAVDSHEIAADQVSGRVTPKEIPLVEVEPTQAEPYMSSALLENDAPQEPVGTSLTPEVRPAQRFGDAHLDMKDGKATLTVTQKVDRDS